MGESSAFVNVLAVLGGLFFGTLFYFGLLGDASQIGEQHMVPVYVCIPVGALIGLIAVAKARMPQALRVFLITFSAALLGVSALCDLFLLPGLLAGGPH